MKNIARVLCVAVFLIVLTVFSLAQNNSATDDIEPVRPYVVRTVRYRINKDGSKKIMSLITTYRNANGEGKIIVHSPTPKDHEPLTRFYYELTPRPEAEEISKSFRSHAALRTHPELIRHVEVAGLEVYVLRHYIENPKSDITWIEDSHSPKLERCPLRSILHFRDGLEVVTEAISVEFKEVKNEFNYDLTGFPIDKLERDLREQIKQ